MKDRISKFISLVLRHKPEVIGISLDSDGYANVDELIKGINKTGRNMDLALLKEIVETDNKGRYSFNETGDKIRANQGHSVKVDVEMQELTPPKYLYHGTAERFIQPILDNGIRKMNRLHVHLSADYDTAVKVGKRHGKPVVLKVKALEMHKAGYRFYLSENKVWLTDNVPSKFIEN